MRLMSIEQEGGYPTLEGTTLLPWSHGNNDVGDIIWDPTNTQELRGVIDSRPEAAVMIDGLYSVLFHEGYYQIFPNSAGYALLCNQDPQRPFVICDFMSESAYYQVKSDQRNTFIRTLLFGGVLGTAVSLSRPRRVESQMSRRRFLGLFLLTLGGMTLGSVIGAKFVQEYSARELTRAVASSDFDSPLLRLKEILRKDPNFGDHFIRTLIASYKFGSLSEEEFTSRGFKKPPVRYGVWGISHLFPSVVDQASVYPKEKFPQAVQALFDREREFLMDKYDHDKALNMIVDLDISIRYSVIARALQFKNSVILELVPDRSGTFYIKHDEIMPF